jgi:hypothetical protein
VDGKAEAKHTGRNCLKRKIKCFKAASGRFFFKKKFFDSCSSATQTIVYPEMNFAL